MPRAGVRRASSVYVRIVRATFHGGPLAEFRGVEAGGRARDIVGSRFVGVVVPTGARVFDGAEDEFVVLTRAFARTAVAFEAVDSNFAELTVTVARNATAPTHIVTRVRRLHGRAMPRITGNLPRSGVELWSVD